MHASIPSLAAHEALLESVPLWLQVVGLVAGALAAAKLIDVVSVGLIRGLVRRTETDLDDLLLEELRMPVVVTIALAGVVAAQGLLPPDLRETVAPFVGTPTLSLLVVLWAWTLHSLGSRLLERARDADTSYASFAPVFSNLLSFGLALAALFAVLDLWGVDVTPLLASAGIAGVAVGFAAKDTVANFFGGLALYFDRTYRVGDYIELGSGETGTVVKVGIRSTTLLTRDEVMVTVPNSVLNNARIINQSAPKRRKRIRVPVAVAYGTDVDALEELLVSVAERADLVMDSPRPRVRFLRFGDSGLEYELRCHVPTPIRETKARHELNRAIYRRLQEAGIEIPYPQRDVHVSRTDDGETEFVEAAKSNGGDD